MFGFDVRLARLVLTFLVRCGICWGLLSLTISDFVSCLSEGMFLSVNVWWKVLFGWMLVLIECFVWWDALVGKFFVCRLCLLALGSEIRVWNFVLYV